MNTHEEHDQSDYSCKDCGNVYATRKSLWVHRYKKHPRPPNPIICEICKKTFFDKTELYYHLKTHPQLQQQHLKDNQSAHGATAESIAVEGIGPETIPPGKYSCHVCGQKFQEKGPLSKHIRIHEMQNNMFSTQPLLSQLFNDAPGVSSSGGGGTGVNVGAIDYKLSYQDNMINGEYACDLCPKTFPILNALHVHRGWHFRSPSGRHVTEAGNTWQPDSIPPSKLRRMKNPYGSPPVCPYCNSTFASTNNLRRHIVEVHKRNEAKLMREKDSNSPNIFIEKVKECQTCNITFKTCTEWIDHKIIHARNQKPSTTFEWGCEICGKMFTRKERLLQHMITHLSSREFDDDGVLIVNRTGDMNFESNSQTSSQSSLQSSINNHLNMIDEEERQRELDGEMDEEDEMDDEMDEDLLKRMNNDILMEGDEVDDDEEEEDDDDDDDDEIMIDELDNVEHSNQTLACELCQMNFKTTTELRRHVANHILNGSGNGQQQQQPQQQIAHPSSSDLVVQPTPPVSQLQSGPVSLLKTRSSTSTSSGSSSSGSSSSGSTNEKNKVDVEKVVLPKF